MKRLNTLLFLALVTNAAALQAAECKLTGESCYTEGNQKCNIKFKNRTGLASGPFAAHSGGSGGQIASAQDITVFAVQNDGTGARGGKHKIVAGGSSTINLTSDNKVEKGFSEIRVVANLIEKRATISCSDIKTLLQANKPVCRVAIVKRAPPSGGLYIDHVGYKCDEGVRGDSQK